MFYIKAFFFAVLLCWNSEEMVQDDTEEMDLYLLIGQSNMAGRGKVDSLNNEINPMIWMLNKQNDWVPARDPLHFDKKEAGVGPGLSFAKEMLERNTGKKIGLIPCAVGGTSISRWMPGGYDSFTNTHPYDDAIVRAKIALRSGKLKGILWHQGEADSGGSQYKSYRLRFDSLLMHLQKDLGTDLSQMPIAVGQLGSFFIEKNPDGHGNEINSILQKIASDNNNIVFVSSEGLKDKGDRTHFDAASARELGRRYAEAMTRLQDKMKKRQK